MAVRAKMRPVANARVSRATSSRAEESGHGTPARRSITSWFGASRAISGAERGADWAEVLEGWTGGAPLLPAHPRAHHGREGHDGAGHGLWRGRFCRIAADGAHASRVSTRRQRSSGLLERIPAGNSAWETRAPSWPTDRSTSSRVSTHSSSPPTSRVPCARRGECTARCDRRDHRVRRPRGVSRRTCSGRSDSFCPRSRRSGRVVRRCTRRERLRRWRRGRPDAEGGGLRRVRGVPDLDTFLRVTWPQDRSSALSDSRRARRPRRAPEGVRPLMTASNGVRFEDEYRYLIATG